ncbi:hypothetical protein HDU80_009635 [Chytriomyces hyalinus]|nr:hypothetical protein HDU80_009635 [Chytriomyces hyalinus]
MPTVPEEIWIKIILFADDTDETNLSRANKLLHRLVFDKIVRRKLQAKNRMRLSHRLSQPQRMNRSQLANLNVLRGTPGMHRRLLQGEYIYGNVGLSSYLAFSKVNWDMIARKVAKALQNRRSSDACFNGTQLVGGHAALKEGRSSLALAA